MGRRLDFYVLLELVMEENTRIGPISRPERHLGAKANLPEMIEDLAQELADIRRIAAGDVAKTDRGAEYLVESTLAMTSVLFSAGAEPSLWRRWAGLTSLGYHLVHRRLSCAQFAALAGEWQLLEYIDHSPVNSSDVASMAFWELIGGNVPTKPQYRDDPFDVAWRSLIHSIPRSDHAITEWALAILAEYWIEDSEGAWEKFQPGEYPNFEQVVNAVSALARHQGFVPKSLSSPQLRFLDAGLAPDTPAPLVPDLVSVVTTSHARGSGEPGGQT